VKDLVTIFIALNKNNSYINCYMIHTVCKEIIGNYIVDHCSTTIVAINMVDTLFDS